MSANSALAAVPKPSVTANKGSVNAVADFIQLSFQNLPAKPSLLSYVPAIPGGFSCGEATRASLSSPWLMECTVGSQWGTVGGKPVVAKDGGSLSATFTYSGAPQNLSVKFTTTYATPTGPSVDVADVHTCSGGTVGSVSFLVSGQNWTANTKLYNGKTDISSYCTSPYNASSNNWVMSCSPSAAFATAKLGKNIVKLSIQVPDQGGFTPKTTATLNVYKYPAGVCGTSSAAKAQSAKSGKTVPALATQITSISAGDIAACPDQVITLGGLNISQSSSFASGKEFPGTCVANGSNFVCALSENLAITEPKKYTLMLENQNITTGIKGYAFSNALTVYPASQTVCAQMSATCNDENAFNDGGSGTCRFLKKNDNYQQYVANVFYRAGVASGAISYGLNVSIPSSTEVIEGGTGIQIRLPISVRSTNAPIWISSPSSGGDPTDYFSLSSSFVCSNGALFSSGTVDADAGTLQGDVSGSGNYLGDVIVRAYFKASLLADSGASGNESCELVIMSAKGEVIRLPMIFSYNAN